MAALRRAWADQHRRPGDTGHPRSGAVRLHLWHAATPGASPPPRRSTKTRPTGTRPGDHHGAIQTTNIYDLNTTAVAIGTGKLLSPESYQKMITKDLTGKTTTVPGCLPQQVGYPYGLGIISSGDWLVQNPLFAGEAGAFAYLPARKAAIAVVVTFMPEAFTSPSSPKNSADYLWRRIAAVLVPADAAPMPPDQQ